MKHEMLLAAILTLTACSAADLLKVLPTDKGISAQVGATNNKVGTGIGKGIEVQNTTDIEAEDNAQVTTGRYHIESKDKLTITINETNPWVIPLVGLYFIGKPLLLWGLNRFRKRKDKIS